jgi:hypothetical protein
VLVRHVHSKRAAYAWQPLPQSPGVVHTTHTLQPSVSCGIVGVWCACVRAECVGVWAMHCPMAGVVHDCMHDEDVCGVWLCHGPHDTAC